MDVVYFTGGTVGAGHFTRGVALGRALVRQGFRGRYRMLGPPLDFAPATAAGYEAIAIEKELLVDPRRAETSVLARRLAELAPDVLVVDLFWALAQHLLAGLRAEPWLLVRAAPEAWLIGPPELRFDPRAWRRVIGIEPIAPRGVRERIAPVVVLNPDELAAPSALREHLGVPAGDPVDVVVHAGKEGEIATLTALAPSAHVMDLRAPEATFPLAHLLAGADRITCGGGYNAFWEARWLGFHGRARFVPFPRRIDDQALRVASCGEHPLRENGADTLAAMLVR